MFHASPVFNIRDYQNIDYSSFKACLINNITLNKSQEILSIMDNIPPNFSNSEAVF